MATKPRSPNYPAFSIQKALEYARKLYAANHLHKATPEVVAKAMGYGSVNGGSLTAISALKKFGLIEEDGKDLRITQDALTVIVEPSSSVERAKVLVRLATLPSLFSELAAAFPGPTPNDEILRSWLLRKGFLSSTVDLPIRAYRETMELAEAQKAFYSSSSQVTTASAPKQEEASEDAMPEVGDLVQWEASGVIRMESPRRVRAKKEHDGASWVFVEGSETGIPMEEVVVVERKEPEAAVRQPPMMALPAANWGSAAITDPREVEASRGKLGGDVHYRLLVTGKMGPKQIGRLIKLLETQKEVLEDEDEPPDSPLA